VGAALGSLFSEGAKLLHIPGFASGTDFAPGGLSLVGEHGPELVNLPRGSQVIPNQPSQQLMNRAPSITIGTVNNYTQADLGSLARDIGFQLALRA
jgi:phage-related tail protein